MNTISIATVSTTAEDAWEPFVHDGHTSGEVRWIAQEARPHGVRWPSVCGASTPRPAPSCRTPSAGSETIHVLEGEAELEQADGTTIDADSRASSSRCRTASPRPGGPCPRSRSSSSSRDGL